MTPTAGPRTFHFWQVDAFSAEPYRGNPAAIVFDAEALTTEEMQTIARQMNLSETVFLLPPSSGAHYRARIFTPRSELPFAGHPTIAAAYAFASTRGVPSDAKGTLVQECGVGLIPVAVGERPEGLLFTLGADADPRVGPGPSREQTAAMLGCPAEALAEEPAEVCSIGIRWLIARVRSLETLESAVPDLSLIERACHECDAVGLTVYCEGGRLEGCSLHVRTFAPGAGISEDPVCGSGNGAVAVHRSRHGLRHETSFRYRAEQGLEVHRRGVVHVEAQRSGTGDALRVHLGGHASKVLEGDLRI